MSRHVTHDGRGALEVRFPFDRSLVDLIKTLPQRRWNASDRFWSVPEADVVGLVELIHDREFTFDEPTRKLYESLGGSLELVGAAPAARAARGPALPGLFDDEAVEPEAQPAGDADDLTVSRLNERVRRVIEGAFPSTVWVVGEISGFNKNAHKRHVSFDLAERTDGGDAVSRVSTTLFDRTRKEIERELEQAGTPFALEDEIQVRMQVRVELYVPWGLYRVVVEGIDINYTLGEAARRREEIVRRLTAEGLAQRNTSLPLPALPLNVALVTSLGSDAYNDVLRTLDESGFAFRVTAHGARVQGHATEPSVLNALDWIRQRAERFDLLLICRGGGSRTDLGWFDSEPLGRAVAQFPLPVVVGIGHEQDTSVLDAFARSCKTPTAAAGLAVEAVRRSATSVEQTAEGILETAAQSIVEHRARQLERGRRLDRATRGRIQQERTQLLNRRERTVVAARRMLVAAHDQLTRLADRIPRAAGAELQRARSGLSASLRSILSAARRDVESCAARIETLGRRTSPAAQRMLRSERERLLARDQRLRLVRPERVLERGYSILNLADGALLTDADAAPDGAKIRARLQRGTLDLVSRGPAPPSDEDHR
ncbi:MAG: exodeoxyribonuclease VII large subunit [bacterium]|nr:exodeoxyribonuclease VII large subunit [bacterium]